MEHRLASQLAAATDAGSTAVSKVQKTLGLQRHHLASGVREEGLGKPDRGRNTHGDGWRDVSQVITACDELDKGEEGTEGNIRHYIRDEGQVHIYHLFING